MKEIGGYFELEKTRGNGEFYPNLIALNTARNSFAYICRARSIKKVYIPFFLCDSIIETCKREDVLYELYHVDSSFLPIFNKTLADNEYLYLVNYYGQIDNTTISNFKQRFKNIIVDNVQAFFQKPIENIDTIYSCRKFVGVPDGAYLSTDCFLKEKLENDCSADRLKHIIGRFKDGASIHYKEFRLVEDGLNNLELMFMSPETHNLLANIDYKYIEQKRNQNFAYLYNHLKKMNALSLNIPDGPFAYPLSTKNASFIRQRLIEKKIYVPLLWPNINDSKESAFAQSILPIPCDQRYDENDMAFIVKEILKYEH